MPRLINNAFLMMTWDATLAQGFKLAELRVCVDQVQMGVVLGLWGFFCFVLSSGNPAFGSGLAVEVHYLRVNPA